MKRLFLAILATLLVACNKPDPKPELKDPIYQDMLAQQAEAKRNRESFEKLLEEYASNIKKVKPQTGQIKYAEKRYWEAKNAVEKLLQQEKYWAVRSVERLKHARKEYLKAFKEGKSWPDQAEIEEYMAEKRLRLSKMQWDSRKRIEAYKNSAPKTAEGAGSAPSSH